MDSDWAWLPVNILDSISEKIKSTRDYLRFGSVCTSWHAVANYNAKKRISSSSHEVPMLMIPSKDEHLHDLFDVTNGRFLKSKLVVPFNKRFSGSSLGWFVTTNSDFSVTLYKPHFKIDRNLSSKVKTIALPRVNQFRNPKRCRRTEYGVTKTVISADPLENPEQCTVMVRCGFCNRLAYIRPSKDTKWSYIDDELVLRGPCTDIIYYKEQFYAVTARGKLLSFEATKEPFNLNPKWMSDKELGSRPGNRYLVELNGKLLQIERQMGWVYGDDEEEESKMISRETKRVIVYEWDFDEKSWNKSEQGIGDYALFLGDNTSISVLASNFAGCKSNSIYFTHDKDAEFSSVQVANDFGLYNILSGTMDLNFNMDVDSLRKISNTVPIWIEPYSIN